MTQVLTHREQRMMKAYGASKAARWAVLPVAILVLGACSAGEGGESPAAQEFAMAAPMEAGPPVVRGLGGEPADPAMGDTIDLRKIGYSRGAADAPVTVYEFSDFGCPFCGMFARGTYPGLHQEFVATGKVRWIYVPFVMGMFPNGTESARAAECAAEQGKFWEMHDLLFAKQNEWKSSRGPERLYNGYARGLGLEAARFATCYREDGGAVRTAQNNRAADALRVRATPSFFINGRLVEGALPAAQFRQVLTSLAGGR